MDGRYSLGVLFVHGIGEQPKADTLLATSEPLLRWLKTALGDQVRLSLNTIHPKLRWLDIYATSDPVSNGRIGSIPGLSSRQIVNRRSWLSDHTTYWQNTSQFVPLVASRIAGLCGMTEALSGRIGLNFRRAAREHRTRVAWLAAARWATALSFALVPLTLPDRLHPMGAAALSLLNQPPLDPVGSFLSGAGRLALPVFSAVGWPTVSLQHAGTVLIGAAIPIGLILAWHFVYSLMWRSWDQRTAERAFTSTERNLSWEEFLRQSIYISLGFLPAALLAIIWSWPGAFATDGLELRVYHLLGWAFVVLAGFTIAAGIVRQALLIRGEMKWKRAGTVAALVAFAAVFAVFLMPGFAPENSRRTVAIGFALAMVSAKLVNAHLKKVNEIESSAAKGMALAGPFLAAILLVIFDPRSNEPFLDRLASAVGLYMCAVGLVMGFAFLVNKWRRGRG